MLQPPSTHTEGVSSDAHPETQNVTSPPRSSALGPQLKIERKRFANYIIVMILFGSCYDYIGKLLFEIIPFKETSSRDFWLTSYLNIITCFTFIIPLCYKYDKLKQFDCLRLVQCIIPATLSCACNWLKILSLAFLPASMVSMFKTSLQLLLLSVLRRYIRNKRLTKRQKISVLIVIIGVIIVVQEKLWCKHKDCSLHNIEHFDSSSLIGLILVFSSAFVGALRNTLDDILIKKNNVDTDTLVAVQGGFSLICTCIIMCIGSVYFRTLENSDTVIIDLEAIFIENGYVSILIWILSILFSVCNLFKEVLKMRVSKMSNSVTRKLFQSLFPIFTWIFTIITFYVTQIGDPLYLYSIIRLIGFLVIIGGINMYFQKKKNGEQSASRPATSLPRIPEDKIVEDFKTEIIDALHMELGETGVNNNNRCSAYGIR